GRRSRAAAPAARARSPDPEQLVGLLRGQPRPQRDRRRGGRARALPLRHGVLGPRLPAGAGDRRAPRAPRPRRAAGARPRRLRARALRPRRAPRRALRGLTSERRARKTNDRATAVSSTSPTYRFPERILYLGEAS